MQLGMIGLGKMGGNMARRLRRAGVDVIGYDHGAADSDIIRAESPQALVEKLDAPRLVWLMLPAGPSRFTGTQPSTAGPWQPSAGPRARCRLSALMNPASRTAITRPCPRYPIS